MNAPTGNPALAASAGSAMDDAVLYRSTMDSIRLSGILVRSLEDKLAISATRHVDHMDGTPYEEWDCPRCLQRWLSIPKIPCSRCYPEEFEALRKTLGKSPNSGMNDGPSQYPVANTPPKAEESQ
jgi:hypothetical protein